MSAGEGASVGATAAISSNASSFNIRPRGILLRCASRSRHAATARNTPSIRRLPVRGFNRSHIASGSA